MGFCNSHKVSHFSTFFINAKAEIFVAESRLVIRKMCTPTPPENGQGMCTNFVQLHVLCRGSLFNKYMNTLPESSAHIYS
ncbi:hypothetical protein RHMOL_Rhmol11G0046100 [Rhododendron molle]|uniref:Uncharacterized protein n=1 Tax=Rhododendron molle TaxID=49168 RepID=A0ACC0LQ48_RHOML|nr:hypothetical protein RHMOL_Rhmol11G0046100 [Rhododendron molle]